MKKFKELKIKEIKIFKVFACFLFVMAFAVFLVPEAGAVSVRIKDIVDIEGARPNQLVGMGLVTGLQGTGDKGQLAMRMMSNMLKNYGLGADAATMKAKNIAVVTVTCELPAFASPGQTLNATVAAAGDAKSLQGGILLQTPLKAANGQTYAVAQGSISLGGYSAGGQGGSSQKNITTAGIVPGGAIVERPVQSDFAAGGSINLLLRQPDFGTAERIAKAINTKYPGAARADDAGRVAVRAQGTSAASFLASIESLTLTPDTVAKVVVNERTGTVVMGGNVTISTVAVAHGSLSVQVSENPQVSQPNPLAQGQTAVTPQTDVKVQEGKGQLVVLPASSSVADLAKAINAVGASPRDLIPILQAMDQAGALHGQLIVQ